MDKKMPMLYPTGWVGGKNFHQGLLNGVNRNKVILHSPKGTLMASFAVKKKQPRNFYDMWIKNFEVKIKHSWTVMMVAGEASAYLNAAEKEEEWLIDVRKNDNHPLTYKDANEFGILLIESLSESNITLYSDYMVVIKDTI